MSQSQPMTWREWVVSNVVLPLSPLACSVVFRDIGERSATGWWDLLTWNTELPFFMIVLTGLTAFKAHKVRYRVLRALEAAGQGNDNTKKFERSDFVVWSLQALAILLAVGTIGVIVVYYVNLFVVEIPPVTRHALQKVTLPFGAVTLVVGGLTQAFDARTP